MFDWNDLRYFLAVADTGSTLAASRELKVSQTTVARRISALETSLSLHLFDRQQSGYVLTPVGEALVSRARAVKGATQDFADAADGLTREHGSVDDNRNIRRHIVAGSFAGF